MLTTIPASRIARVVGLALERDGAASARVDLQREAAGSKRPAEHVAQAIAGDVDDGLGGALGVRWQGRVEQLEGAPEQGVAQHRLGAAQQRRLTLQRLVTAGKRLRPLVFPGAIAGRCKYAQRCQGNDCYSLYDSPGSCCPSVPREWTGLKERWFRTRCRGVVPAKPGDPSVGDSGPLPPR